MKTKQQKKIEKRIYIVVVIIFIVLVLILSVPFKLKNTLESERILECYTNCIGKGSDTNFCEELCSDQNLGINRHIKRKGK